MLFFILVCVILWAVKASKDEDELLRNKNTAAPSTSDNETQIADNAPNDGSTPTQSQPAAQGAPYGAPCAAGCDCVGVLPSFGALSAICVSLSLVEGAAVFLFLSSSSSSFEALTAQRMTHTRMKNSIIRRPTIIERV